MNDLRATPDADPIATLDALATALARLEPQLELWLTASSHALSERERARRAAMHLRLQASRIVAVLDAVPAQSGPAPWRGQERRGPNRATNVARLPERPDDNQDRAAPGPADWEPF